MVLWRKNRLLAVNASADAVPQAAPPAAETEEAKYSHSRLTEEQRETLMTRIQQLLGSTEVICQQDFTLGKLSKMADSNTTYVSQVINEKYGMTFSNVLGSLRVREACRRMTDTEDTKNFTIEAIASSVGFKSRTSFLNAFKRETGCTPSEYQRQTTVGKP